MKNLLVLLVLSVVLVSKIQAAKVIFHKENNARSNVESVTETIPIPAEYVGMQATFIISGEIYSYNQSLSCMLQNPSLGILASQTANDPTVTNTNTHVAHESVGLLYTGILESGNYLATAYNSGSAYGPSVGLKSVICIVWDAPGQDVIDLKAELQAEIATTRAELQGSIDTKTADLQTQIDTKAQELADLADEHEADKTQLESEIADLKAILDAFIIETRAKQDYLTEQITTLNTVITERLRRLENRVKLAVYATTKLTEMKTQSEASLLAKQTEIVQLDLEIQALEDTGEDTSLKIALRKIALTEYTSLQIDLEDIVAAIDLRENDSEFAALRAEIVSLYSITSAMDARIVELEGLVVILKKSIEDGDDELHAKIDAQITLLREEIMDKIDKDLYETSKHFDDLRQMIKDISDAQSTSTSTGTFDSPSLDSLKVPVDTRDMRVSPGQTI